MRKQVLKWCKFFSIAVIVMIVVPLFFKQYPDFRFFWSTTVVFVASFQLFWVIVRKKGKKIQRLRFVSILLMSVITANELYSYDKLVFIFPVLKKIPASLMIGIGVILLVLAAVGGGIYNMANYFRRNHSEVSENTISTQDHEGMQLEGPDTAELLQDNFHISNTESTGPINLSNGNIENTCQVNLPVSDAESNCQSSLQKTSVRQPILHLRQIVGTVLSAAIALAGMGILFYILLVNQAFLQSNTLQQLPYYALSLLMTFGVIGMILFLIAIMTFLFIRTCYHIVVQMYTQQKLDLQNDLFLKCISGFLVVLYFVYGKSTTIEDLFNLASGTNQLVSLLAMVIAMTIIIVMTLIVYKILKSLVNPEGYLRKHIDEIFHLILKIVCEAIEKILNMAQSIPDVIENLPQMIKKGWNVIVNILFELDEEEEEDGKAWCSYEDKE